MKGNVMGREVGMWGEKMGKRWCKGLRVGGVVSEAYYIILEQKATVNFTLIKKY